MILSNQEINQKNIDSLKKQSIDSLVQKKIKEIELERFNYQISQNRINDYLKGISINYEINLEDKSFLHKKHLGNQEGRYHLKLSIESNELKKLNKIESNKKIYKALDQELKEYIHSLQILIK